ncbi:MAG: DUF1844 domain-containing protein [Candidatus Omnitrophica bacterium]|nr:DUF1844 domain-containing protein [Candidatus Omnitrophota bacterium]
MDIQNRWGDSLNKDGSGALLGPDGQPLSPGGPSREEHGQEGEPQLDFFNYISSLAFQAMIFLGEEKNLKQAKFLIDTLALIREKTIGNLTKEEGELLNGSIYELQCRFVEMAQKEPKS